MFFKIDQLNKKELTFNIRAEIQAEVLQLEEIRDSLIQGGIKILPYEDSVGVGISFKVIAEK